MEVMLNSPSPVYVFGVDVKLISFRLSHQFEIVFNLDCLINPRIGCEMIK